MVSSKHIFPQEVMPRGALKGQEERQPVCEEHDNGAMDKKGVGCRSPSAPRSVIDLRFDGRRLRRITRREEERDRTASGDRDESSGDCAASCVNRSPEHEKPARDGSVESCHQRHIPL